MFKIQGCGVGVKGLSFEEDSDSGPYLSHLDFYVILLQLFDFCAIYSVGQKTGPFFKVYGSCIW